MADHTLIEWTDATWNPITGCAVASPGCTNCYAMSLAGTRLRHHPSREGLTRDTKAGPVWTGEVRFNPQWLHQPLQWSRPRMIFVCAHGDLFAEGVPDDWIDQVFAVMALASQHTFQVLTKRAGRMRQYLSDPDAINRRYRAIEEMTARIERPHLVRILPNVWLGVSVEDQPRAQERIPDLLQTPAAIRWISAEPVLGEIDLTCIDVDNDSFINALTIRTWEQEIEAWRDTEADWEHSFLDWFDLSEMPEGPMLPRLDWVVAGGESGAAARPMQLRWVRALRDQCAAAGVPFLFKQWGEWHPWGQKLADGMTNLLKFREDPRLFRQIDGEILSRVGKRAAGRRLDGIEHNGFPVTPAPAGTEKGGAHA